VAACLTPEHRKRGPRAEERPHEIHLHHPAHRLDGGLFHGAVVTEPRIAQHDVEAPEGFLGAGDEARDVILRRDVGDERLRTMAGGLDRADGFVEPVCAPGAEDHRAPGGGQLPRTREPDAGRSARDDRDPSGETHSRMIQE
jgi:hypothetical protein